MKLLHATFFAWTCSLASGSLAFAFAPPSRVVRDSPSRLYFGLDLEPSTADSTEAASPVEAPSAELPSLADELRELKKIKEFLADLAEKSYSAVSAPSTDEDERTAQRPRPPLRTDMGDVVLLSGVLDKQLRIRRNTKFDSTLLDLLNNNPFGGNLDCPPNFRFRNILAMVDDSLEGVDAAVAKKWVVSREARYSGLLDKLQILTVDEAATKTGDRTMALPDASRLRDGNVASWILHLSWEEASELLPKVAEVAKVCEELKHVFVLVEGGMNGAKAWKEGWKSLLEASDDGSSFRCTLLAVGELYDGGVEGKPYHIGTMEENDAVNASATDATAVVEAPKLSRKEAYQMIAHCLALESTANRALIAYEHAATTDAAVGRVGDQVVMESRLIQGMRECGFSKGMELDVLIDKGIKVSSVKYKLWCITTYNVDRFARSMTANVNANSVPRVQELTHSHNS